MVNFKDFSQKVGCSHTPTPLATPMDTLTITLLTPTTFMLCRTQTGLLYWNLQLDKNVCDIYLPWHFAPDHTKELTCTFISLSRHPIPCDAFCSLMCTLRILFNWSYQEISNIFKI
jgi:hypothetical protein